MITSLHGFHAIAAARGDGLHPKLLRMIASLPASTEVEHTDGVTVIDSIGAKPVDEVERRARSVEVVAMLLQSHR